MTSDGLKQVAPEPYDQTIAVDPAGLHHVQRLGPKGAGGAAGKIYKWLKIHEEKAFPKEVREAIQEPLQAKLQVYGSKACLHVVGPDLRNRNVLKKQACRELCKAYQT